MATAPEQTNAGEIAELGAHTYDARAQGEPEFPLIIWDLDGWEEPKTLDVAIEELRATAAVCVQQQQSIRWLRAELEKTRLKAGPEAGTEAANAIKLEVVKSMQELLPQAKRAAKRGKPALLRLIVRTIKTKL